MSRQATKWEDPDRWRNNHGQTMNRQKKEDHDLMTINEVALAIRVSTATLKRWEKVEGEKKLHPIRINSRGDRRYLREEIQRFIGVEHGL